MSRGLARLLLLVTAGCTAPGTPGPTFETSGLDRFWEVHDTLAADREPSPTLWDSLWASPGYALLEEREHRRSALSAAMRFAFKPSLLDRQDSVIGGGGWAARGLLHMRRITPLRDTLEAFRRALRTGDWIDQGRTRAQAYLPPGTIERYPPPEVSLLHFLDARGYQRLLIDPLYFLRLRNPLGVLAHEFHHYYNGRLPTPADDYGDDLLAWVLATTESEGIAGLLDKAWSPSSNASAATPTRPRCLEGASTATCPTTGGFSVPSWR